jgi:hypothetical protein
MQSCHVLSIHSRDVTTCDMSHRCHHMQHVALRSASLATRTKRLNKGHRTTQDCLHEQRRDSYAHPRFPGANLDGPRSMLTKWSFPQSPSHTSVQHGPTGTRRLGSFDHQIDQTLLIAFQQKSLTIVLDQIQFCSAIKE